MLSPKLIPGNKWSETSVIASTTTVTLYYGPFIYTGGTLSRVVTHVCGIYVVHDKLKHLLAGLKREIE